MSKYTCVHKCIFMYIHTYVRTYIHECVYIYTQIDTLSSDFIGIRVRMVDRANGHMGFFNQVPSMAFWRSKLRSVLCMRYQVYGMLWIWFAFIGVARSRVPSTFFGTGYHHGVFCEPPPPPALIVQGSPRPSALP